MACDTRRKNPISKFLVVGVGTSGCKIIKHIEQTENPQMALLAIDEDAQNYPSLLLENLQGVEIVVILGGLGGNATVEIASAIANISKMMGALVLALMSLPYKFEGRKRVELAKESLTTLKTVCHSVVVISNDKLLSTIEPTMGMKEAFEVVNGVFFRLANAFYEVMANTHGENTLFDCYLKGRLMRNETIAISVAKSQGENAAFQALKEAISFHHVDDFFVKDSKNIFVYVEIHPNIDVISIAKYLPMINSATNNQTEIFYKTSLNENIPSDLIKIIFISQI